MQRLWWVAASPFVVWLAAWMVGWFACRFQAIGLFMAALVMQVAVVFVYQGTGDHENPRGDWTDSPPYLLGAATCQRVAGALALFAFVLLRSARRSQLLATMTPGGSGDALVSGPRSP